MTRRRRPCASFRLFLILLIKFIVSACILFVRFILIRFRRNNKKLPKSSVTVTIGDRSLFIGGEVTPLGQSDMGQVAKFLCPEIWPFTK